jgi:hypothetical protein
LSGGRIEAVRTHDRRFGKRSVYAARIEQIPATSAQSACRALKQRKRSTCTVIASTLAAAPTPAAVVSSATLGGMNPAATGSGATAHHKAVALNPPAPRPRSRRASATTGGAGSRGSQPWGVQVGAFSGYAPAYATARDAVAAVPSLLEDGKIHVAPLRKANRKRVYRARVLGIAKREAYGACKVLAREDFPCMVFRM